MTHEEARAALRAIYEVEGDHAKHFASLFSYIDQQASPRQQGGDGFQLAFVSERALCRKLEAEYSASRVGIMALQGELHEHLALMVRYLEEEGSQGDGISERHFDGYQAAKSLLARTAANQPSWENAQVDIHELMRKASSVPGAREPAKAGISQDWQAAVGEFRESAARLRATLAELPEPEPAKANCPCRLYPGGLGHEPDCEFAEGK
jgi:hypothetical protein